MPVMIASAGDHAARRFLEFFAGQIRNKNTRMAYHRATCHLFAWVEQHQIGELADIEPIHVAAYIEVLQTTAAKPTVKLHLAAMRMLFDWLVVGHILAVNPAHAVRGPKHVVRRGKTPVLTEEQARRLIQSLDTSTLVGLRDRALIGVMTYAFARIGAGVAMKVEDYYPQPSHRRHLARARRGAPPRRSSAYQPASGSHETRRWREMDSNLQSPKGRPDKQRRQPSTQFLCGDRASEFARLAAGGTRFEPLGPRRDKRVQCPLVSRHEWILSAVRATATFSIAGNQRETWATSP